MKANVQAYRVICDAMSRIDHVQHHKNDFYRVDRNYLMGEMGVDAPESFGFVMRYNGTQLDDPRRQDWTRSTLEHIYRETWGIFNCRFFWYAYGTLKEYEFSCYLMKWDEWHTFYQDHWDDAWTPYFLPQR